MACRSRCSCGSGDLSTATIGNNYSKIHEIAERFLAEAPLSQPFDRESYKDLRKDAFASATALGYSRFVLTAEAMCQPGRESDWSAGDVAYVQSVLTPNPEDLNSFPERLQRFGKLLLGAMQTERGCPAFESYCDADKLVCFFGSATTPTSKLDLESQGMIAALTIEVVKYWDSSFAANCLGAVDKFGLREKVEDSLLSAIGRADRRIESTRGAPTIRELVRSDGYRAASPDQQVAMLQQQDAVTHVGQTIKAKQQIQAYLDWGELPREHRFGLNLI